MIKGCGLELECNTICLKCVKCGVGKRMVNTNCTKCHEHMIVMANIFGVKTDAKPDLRGY